VSVLCALAVVAGAAVAAAFGAQPTPTDYVPGQLLVRFEPGVRSAMQASLLGAEGARVEGRLDAHTALVHLPAGSSVAEAVEALEQRADVADAQPNFVYTTQVFPNDERFAELWGLPKIGAPAAWDSGTGSRDVTVAVTDTGIRLNHPDLAANIVPGGHDFIGNDDDPSDEHGHGTHVAGIIGATGNNTTGVTGVNWSVGLLPVRVLNASGQGSTFTIAQGFRYAAARARIVNASLGGSANDAALQSAIVDSPNTLFVVAAGNSGLNTDVTASYPCAYPEPNIICVAATDSLDSLAWFSNRGTTTVDIAAPGSSILSTWNDGGYNTISGTSMATPYVAGAAALVWSRNPALTAAQVKATLLASVDALGLPVASGGRLNVARAVGAVTPPPPPPPPPPAVTPPPPPPVVTRRPAKKVVRRVTICHRGRTVKVKKANLRRHLRHGDKRGACRKPAKRR
jgi:subtilisin family serine protease